MQDEAIRPPSSDKRREPVETNYNVETDELDLTSVIEGKFPEELVRLTGINAKSIFRQDYVEIDKDKADPAKKAKWEAEGRGGSEYWAENAYSKEERTIIAIKNIRRFDLLPDDKQLPWSEIVWQAWKSTAGDKVKDLRWVVQSNIVNEKTLDIMDEAYRRLDYRAGEPSLRTFERGKSADMDDAFYVLGGTDNVSGVFRLTADKPNELGGLKVNKIHTWFQGRKRVTNSFIVVELDR